MKGRVSPFAVLVISCLAWWAVASALDAVYLPTPLAVAKALAVAIRADLVGHFTASLGRVAAALAIALALGVPCGIWIGRSPGADRALSALLYAVFPIPKIVFLPVLLLAMGLGDGPKVALITLTLFFQVLVTTRDAARTLPESALRSIEALGATRPQALLYVVLPHCAPAVFTALRIGTGTAVAVLFFAESFATDKGLGYLIMTAWSRADYPGMYAGIAAMSVLGLGLYAIIDIAQRAICPWLRVQ